MDKGVLGRLSRGACFPIHWRFDVTRRKGGFGEERQGSKRRACTERGLRGSWAGEHVLIGRFRKGSREGGDGRKESPSDKDTRLREAPLDSEGSDLFLTEWLRVLVVCDLSWVSAW